MSVEYKRGCVIDALVNGEVVSEMIEWVFRDDGVIYYKL